MIYIAIDTQSRKWLITINNPVDHGFTHERIKNELSNFKSLMYWCMSDEVGLENGMYHTHVFIALSSACRHSTVRGRFSWPLFDKDKIQLVDKEGNLKFGNADIQMAKGTSQQNRDYVFKEAKWLNDEKADTNLRETHEEYGTMPVERPGTRNDLADLYDMISSGMSNYQIIEVEPKFLFNIDKLERIRQTVREEQFKKTYRQLEVTYIYGSTGTGKTRGVMEQYGYENVYRVTDYKHPFDGYNGQDVVVFEEFRYSLKIQDMLNYLDGYPLVLPSRYMNKVACYTKVYIITNLPLNMQYPKEQEGHKETWKAFLRRIKKVFYYDDLGNVIERDKDFEELGFVDVENESVNPFEIFSDYKQEELDFEPF